MNVVNNIAIIQKRKDLMTKMIKTAIILLIAGGIGIWANDVHNRKVATAKKIAHQQLEQTCKEYGVHMGYDVDLSDSGTCFVHMDHGTTVPLDVALDLQKVIFAGRQEIDNFKRLTKAK